MFRCRPVFSVFLLLLLFNTWMDELYRHIGEGVGGRDRHRRHVHKFTYLYGRAAHQTQRALTIVTE